jgi:transposase
MGVSTYIYWMFVRQKTNKSGSVSVQIVQKIGRINRVIRTIGCSSDPAELDKLQQQAEYEKERFHGPTLFDPIPIQDLKNVTNDCIRVIGPDIVFGVLYARIGFDVIREPLLKALAISRLTHPGSKLKLSEYLNVTGRDSISVYSIYRFLDKISGRYKSQIEHLSFAYTKRILNGDIGIVFYDMTTIYFESSQPDELRIPGFSKEGKHHLPQIYLGLLVGCNGYPIGYDIFKGNIFEGHTLIPILERFEKQFSIGHPIVVADAGLLSKSNIEELTKRKYKFILGARVKNEGAKVVQVVQGREWANGDMVEYLKPDGSRLIIEYTESRAKKDEFNRTRGIRKLEKQVNTGKLTKSNLNNRGYNKYLKLDGDISISIDYQKYDNDRKWDGIKGYVTNTDLTRELVVNRYRDLWQIEKAFRISKTDLQIRPVYHRRRDRIESHICISFMAYMMYKELERLLMGNNLKTSVEKAIEQINKIYEIIIPGDDGSQSTFRPHNNPLQQKIIEIISSS